MSLFSHGGCTRCANWGCVCWPGLCIHLCKFDFRGAGLFCVTDASVGSDEVVMSLPNVSGSPQTSCGANRGTLWSPTTGSGSYTFNVMIQNKSASNLSVKIHGGLRDSSSAWPVVKTVNVPGQTACSIQYSPRLEFTIRRGEETPPQRFLWGGSGKGTVRIRPHAFISAGVGSIAITGGGSVIGYGITDGLGWVPRWISGTNHWEGSAGGEYRLQLRKANVRAGLYSGRLTVSLTCD